MTCEPSIAALPKIAVCPGHGSVNFRTDARIPRLSARFGTCRQAFSPEMKGRGLMIMGSWPCNRRAAGEDSDRPHSEPRRRARDYTGAHGLLITVKPHQPKHQPTIPVAGDRRQ